MCQRKRRILYRAAYKRVVMAEWVKEKKNGVTHSAFCLAYGLSRGTLYSWFNPKGNKQKKVIHRVDPMLKTKAIEIYLRYKGTWSAETISMALKGKLSATTIRKVIAPYRSSSVKEVSEKKSACVLKTAAAPNIVWSVDWTEYKVRGKKFFVLLFIDEASRFYLGWYIFTSSPTGKDTAECLRDLLARYEARPFIVKSDRAKAFMCFEWLEMLKSNGISHHKIRPHCPQDQGVVERGMREVKLWLRATSVFNGKQLETCLDDGMFMLNFLKPRIVLDGETPAKVYFHGNDRRYVPLGVETKYSKEGICLAE